MYILRVIRPDDPWRQLHRCQWIVLGLFVGFVPVGSILIAGWGYTALFPFAAIYGGVLLFCQDRAINWKCPRCHKPFLRKHGNGYAMPWRKHCGNCGLKHGSLL
jgi:hypothetical protein